jgi:hypothetical protein
MTDLLTMVFTGLVIIQPDGHVNAVRAHDHKLVVTLDDKAYEVAAALSFEGFAAKASGLVGELPPDLESIVSTSSPNLSIDPKSVTRFQVPAGTTSLGGDSATCSIGGKRTVFWQGVVWEGRATGSATIVIDGTRHSLANVRAVRISNEYQGTGDAVHIPMYMTAVKGADLKYHAPVCTYSASLPRNNPITCPPVSLR